MGGRISPRPRALLLQVSRRGVSLYALSTEHRGKSYAIPNKYSPGMPCWSQSIMCGFCGAACPLGESQGIRGPMSRCVECRCQSQSPAGMWPQSPRHEVACYCGYQDQAHLCVSTKRSFCMHACMWHITLLCLLLCLGSPVTQCLFRSLLQLPCGMCRRLTGTMSLTYRKLSTP